MRAALALLAWGCAAGHAQLPATAPRAGVWSPDNLVRAATTVGSTLYIGGAFRQVGPLTGGFAMIDAGTAELVAPTPYVDGIVRASAPDGAGGWYIAGTFSRVGGAPRSSVARVHADGSLDPWSPAAGGAGVDLFSIAKVGNTVYIGGYGLWAASASTGAAVPVNFALQGVALAMAVDGDRLYIGGGFSGLLGQSRSALAAIDTTTNALLPWNPGASGNISAIALADGLAYVGGSFSTAGGLPRQNCAAISQATGLASPFDPAPSGSVYAMAIDSATLYIGGRFTSVTGQPRSRLAALDRASGSLLPWSPVADYPPNLAGTPEVDALAVSGQSVLIGGAFERINTQSRPGIGAVDSSTGAVLTWNPRPGHDIDPNVYAIRVASPGAMIGGRFTITGGEYREGLAAYDLPSGALLPWHPVLNPPPGELTQIFAMAAGSGRVFASGGYGPDVAGPVAHTALVALAPSSGAVDPNFVPFSPLNMLHSMVVAGNTLCLPCTAPGNLPSLCGLDTATGDLVWFAPASGGDAVLAYGAGTNQVVAAVNGSIRAYNPLTGAAGPWSIALDSVLALRFTGSRLFVAGGFNSIAGISRYGLAAIDFPTPDAPALAAWAPVPAPNSVTSMATQGQAVYVMGSFQNIGGAFRPLVAAVNWQNPAACAWTPRQPVGAGSVLAANDSALVLSGYRSFDRSITLPRLAIFDMHACIADMSGDCLLNVLDFSAFLNAYAAGLPAANCDGSTTAPALNVLDFACFVNAYATGCP